jgi:hypothetical protein
MDRQRLLLSALAVSLLFVTCKKDDDESGGPAPTPATVNPMRAIFHGHVADAMQTFTVNASTGGNVVGADGTTIVFPANAFRTQSGGMVTGTVQVELVEALNVGDMIWLNKQTLGNDNGQMKPLVSGGQYYLNVTQGGQQLQLADNAGQVYVPAPNGPDPNMQLFVGDMADDGTIVWDPFSSAALPQFDSSNFVFGNDTLGWVNCDYFMGSGTQTTVNITCPAGHAEANTLLWLVFPDQNAMTALHASAGSSFGTGGYYTLPVGLNMKIVALSNAGGTYSSSITTTTVTAGMNPSITFSPTTLVQFEADLNGL